MTRQIKNRDGLTPELARQRVIDADQVELAESVKRFFNCRECEIDDAGDIAIADPQERHWLSDGDLVRFVEHCG